MTIITLKEKNMLDLEAQFPRLSVARKKRFLDYVADGYTLPCNLSNEISILSNKMEQIAIQKLIRDYFFYSDNKDIAILRDETCNLVENMYSHAQTYYELTRIIEFLYQPQYVKLMFEDAISNISKECGLKHYEIVEKSFKFRDSFRHCERDKKNGTSVRESSNPIIPVLFNIVESIYSEAMLEDTSEYEMSK